MRIRSYSKNQYHGTLYPTVLVLDKNGVVQYSEQTPTPKDLPNFNAIRDTLSKLK